MARESDEIALRAARWPIPGAIVWVFGRAYRRNFNNRWWDRICDWDDPSLSDCIVQCNRPGVLELDPAIVESHADEIRSLTRAAEEQ